MQDPSTIQSSELNQDAQIDLDQWRHEIQSFIDETSGELHQISQAIEGISPNAIQPVSYTHLTLPTKA